MKKLHLQLEELEVDSFTTERNGEERGTVRARDSLNTYGTMCWPYCSGGTCDDTSCNCDSYTCPGAGGECDKKSMWYNDCEI